MSNNPVQLKNKRWIYLLSFCLINFISGALYIWSVFAAPFASYFNQLNGTELTSSDLSSVFGLAAGLTPFLMLAGGYINDRMGPKLVVALGGLAIGVGYLICGYADSPSLLYIGYGFFVGVGTGMVNGCTINSAVKFFPDRRGFAGGLVTSSLGIGAAALPFLVNALVVSIGISDACIIFGLGSAILICLLTLFTAKCPDDFANEFCDSPKAASVSGIETNWIGMIKSTLFIPLFVLFVTGSTMGLMLISSISGIANHQIGLGMTASAMAVSVISIANTLGRFISGTASDKFGRVPTLMFMLLLAIAGFVLLLWASPTSAWLFFTGTIFVGICYGSFIGTYPSLVADEYGNKNNSVNFSVMMLGYSIGGFGGPQLLKWAQQAGSYDRAYLICITAAALGIICGVIYLLIKKHQLSAASFS